MNVRRVALLSSAALLLSLAAWQSVVTIDNGQRGIIERYGRPVRDLLPGLHVKLPFGMERVRTVPGPERSLPRPRGTLADRREARQESLWAHERVAHR